MQSARAVRIQGPGGPEVLQLAAFEVPAPGPSQVLVEIKAAGLNRADLLQRKGVYPAPPGAPADVPGLEFAGVVAAVGQAVSAVAVGDRVMAITGGGSMASHILMHERELVPIPQNLSFTDAAAVPEVFMTAYDAMLLQGCLGMGQHVLIHAAGSGVGTAAIQLARAVGAVPLGTSRKAEKLERAREFGLVHGIVTSEPVFADRVLELTRKRGVELVLDTIGAKYLGENLRALATSGTIVTIGLLGGVKADLMLGLLVQKRACLRGSVLRSRPLEEKIALAQRFSAAVLPLLASGELRPVVEDVLPMADVQKAHARLEADDTFGKLVLAW
jgi:NADPH2:quinone reductase